MVRHERIYTTVWRWHEAVLRGVEPVRERCVALARDPDFADRRGPSWGKRTAAWLKIQSGSGCKHKLDRGKDSVLCRARQYVFSA